MLLGVLTSIHMNGGGANEEKSFWFLEFDAVLSFPSGIADVYFYVLQVAIFT